MKNLIQKYRTRQLTTDEIKEARERVNSMSDEQLSVSIEEDWHNFEPAGQQYDKDVKGRLFNIIFSNHINQRSRWGKIWDIVRTAAVIALPILLVCTLFIYNKDNRDVRLATTISTGGNEKATLRLPDNSIVELGSNSSIEYDMTSFGGDARSVKFSGEAYFNISKVEGRTFVVDASGVDVIVKGTAFNLEVYEDCDEASLYLVNGSVLFKTDDGNAAVELSPEEIAVFNRSTGEIQVSKIGENDNPLAWKDGKLFFKNAELQDVLRQIGKHFRCVLVVEDSFANERFTGLVPLDDLDMAVSVVEKAFSTDIVVK